MSTERRVLPNTRRYANHWVTVLIRINERQGHGSEFSLRNENLSGQTFAGTGDSSAERVDEYTFSHATVRPDGGTNLIAQWNCLVAQKLSCRPDMPLHVQRFSARTENHLLEKTFAATCDLFTNCHCVMTTATAAVLAESEDFLRMTNCGRKR